MYQGLCSDKENYSTESKRNMETRWKNHSLFNDFESAKYLNKNIQQFACSA